MLYQNSEVTKYFKEETIHVMDYDFEYDQGFPDAEKFPEFNNKVFSNNTIILIYKFKIKLG